MRTSGVLFGILAVGLFVSSASAQLVINPLARAPSEKIEVGIAAAYSSIDYTLFEFDKNNGVDRWVIGVSAARAYDEKTDICGSAVWLAKSDPEGSVDSSGGYLLSLGARSHIYERGLAALTVYGLGHYMSEKYEIAGASYDMFLFELTGGALGSYAIKPTLIGYAGVELIAYSDGESRGASRFDIERDGKFTLRGGTMFVLNKYWIRTELALGSETALTVGAGRPF